VPVKDYPSISDYKSSPYNGGGMTMHSRRLQTLINNLSSPDASKRRSAADALSAGDERAIYPLVKALKDENQGVQDAAMRSLISIGGEVTAYMVVPQLRGEAYLRNTALIILKDIGPATLPTLSYLFKDKDDDVRKFALDLICEIGQYDTPGEIVSLLRSDPNANVRASAAKALGILDFRDALPDLLKALKDEEWVCFSALESLALMGDEAPVIPITDLLVSKSETVRFAAIETLGKVTSAGSSDALLKHFLKVEGFEKEACLKSLIQNGITPSMTEVSGMLMEMFVNSEWDDRMIALKGLADLGDPKAVFNIIDIAGSLDASNPDDEERLYVIKDSLRSFGCAGALLDALDNPALRFRGKQIAIELVGDLGCSEAVPHLIRLFESKLRDVKRASIRALGEIDGGLATKTLVEAIHDDYDGHVRRIAVAALGRLGIGEAVTPLLQLLQVERYRDVIQEAVSSLMVLDPQALAAHINEMSPAVRDVAEQMTNEGKETVKE